MIRSPIVIRSILTTCPACGLVHVDEGEWRDRPHRKHLCASCGAIWAPAQDYTRGVSRQEFIESRVRRAFEIDVAELRAAPVPTALPGPGEVPSTRVERAALAAFKVMLLLVLCVDVAFLTAVVVTALEAL